MVPRTSVLGLTCVRTHHLGGEYVVDEAMLRWVNGWSAHEGIAAWATFASSNGMVVLICTPVALYLLYRRRFVAMATIALSMGIGDIVTARLLKPAFDRERPCRAVTELIPAAKCGAGRSFPSGHATVAFAFYVSAAPAIPYGWVLLLPPAATVAASRVQLGVHYPSDVLGGALVGSLVGLGGIAVRRRALRRGRRDPSPDPTPT